MTAVTVNKTIQVPASEAWAKLSSFKNIEEISPIIVKSETIGAGVGATRIYYMPDNGAAAAIHETLHKVEDTTMELQYKMTKGPFPISGYVSDIKVTAIGDFSCTVTWGCQFETDDKASNNSAMIELFEGFYHAIIEGLETRIQNKHKLQKQKRFILDLFWTIFFYFIHYLWKTNELTNTYSFVFIGLLIVFVEVLTRVD
ncbi:hypothetical protein FRACYDRAFT_243706 [Fragilariopsis cylindrus CCMP1102]|uniref:Bet v I/Major latex protein domain-containing protein n=1 Tax=Fragilariopsis cylindrus CCMP1102 TaxID=635003 RepID=A0A1E7F2U4_9STRA|nr:hypothetical protein FRACYDRAFT_243706 [Fragilariopsis cylindrus CCMP1102]|eukprot:OEU12454.1 hypothetical protein FRACYDRAFT_243706 [Fragilariopsis cylindrus CCMP1102]